MHRMDIESLVCTHFHQSDQIASPGNSKIERVSLQINLIYTGHVIPVSLGALFESFSLILA